MSASWRSLPAHRGRFLTGSLAAFRAAPHRFPADLAEAHGGLARFRILHRPFVAVTHPEAIQHILNQPDVWVRGPQYRNMQPAIGRGLLSTDGPDWRHRRSLLNPLFRSERLRQVIDITQACLRSQLDDWEQTHPRGGTIGLCGMMRTLTITVMARTLLSHDLSRYQIERLSDLVHTGTMRVRQRNISIWNPPLWVPVRRNRDLLAGGRFLHDLLAAEIRRARQGDTPPNNLLATLLSLDDPATGQPLPDEALIDELRNLLVAGFETTSAALAWTVWRLARHPGIARVWQAEIDSIPPGQPLTLDWLKRLPVTESILTESLRLHPPVYNMARVTREDQVLCGQHIPRGTTAMISIYGLHRSARLWTDPLSFRPDRFAAAGPPPQNWIPFGAGPHLCIGMAFALLEMKSALSVLGQRFHLRLADDRDVPERAEISLSPATEILLHLEPR